MKKKIALFFIAIFIVSLIPVSFADEGSNSLRISTEDNATEIDVEHETDVEVESDSNSGRTNAETSIRQETRIKAKENKEEFNNRLKALRNEHRIKIEALNKEKKEKFAELSSERLQKIAELDERQLEKLSALNISNIDKLAQLKSERLKKLTELNEEKLKRLAELKEDRLEMISDLNGTEIEKLAVLNRFKLKELARLDKEKLRIELKTYKIIKVKNLDDLDEKNLTEERIEWLKEKFEEAKVNLTSANEDLKEARDDLKGAMKDRREDIVVINSKTYLLRSITVMVSHLDKIKIQVQENTQISDDEGAEIVADIDAQISELNSLKAEVEAATTKEQLKELAKKLREKWHEIKETRLLLHAERVMDARIEGLIKRSNVLEKRLDKILDNANESIQADLSQDMELFSQKIATAQDKYNQAKAKLSEAFSLRLSNSTGNTEQIKALVDEAKELRKESHEALKEAHDVLKIIVMKLRLAHLEANLSADVEVEIAD